MPVRLVALLALSATPAVARGALESEASRPHVVMAVPAAGAVARAGATELVWTFSEPMDPRGFSVTGDPAAMPRFIGKPSFSADHRTFRLRVQLEPERRYDIGVNSKSYRNFRSARGVTASMQRFRFTSR